jgi:hypothetical protein
MTSMGYSTKILRFNGAKIQGSVERNDIYGKKGN